MSSTSADESIVKAKLNLQNALGERFIDYMQSMRKWFMGKSSKQEFDKEAREIVTDNYVHLHNEFLLCIITKCNNFSTSASQLSSKTILPILPASTTTTTTSASRNVNTTKTKLNKKQKTSSNDASSKYNLRFVPVDPIKHAPSIITASIETAALASQDFALEFCAREKSLPYAKMIHNRMLLAAIDFNLQQVDSKAVFLLAEATIYMLKTILEKLLSRSKFKSSLRSQFAFEQFKLNNLTDAKVLENHKLRTEDKNEFVLDESVFKSLKNQDSFMQEEEIESKITYTEEMDKEELELISNDLNNKLKVPVKKLDINLFDLKNLLQSNKSLMPSHTIYTINMEKIICNMWHESETNLNTTTSQDTK